jgi:hypothetical protein
MRHVSRHRAFCGSSNSFLGGHAVIRSCPLQAWPVNARRHRGSHANRLLGAAEVVVAKVECHRIFKILQLLGESVRKLQAAHVHPHREVLPLHLRDRK